MKYTNNLMKIIIEGERVKINSVKELGNDVAEITSENRSWIVASSKETAGAYVANQWEDMAKYDPEEFTAILGAERLVSWLLGVGDTFGCQSLEDFLWALAQTPEEHLSYTGRVCEIDGRGWDKDLTITEEFENELGFQPWVAYQTY